MKFTQSWWWIFKSLSNYDEKNPKIALKAWTNKYLTGHLDHLDANQPLKLDWEIFRLWDNEDGTFALQTRHSKYVTACPDGRVGDQISWLMH